MAYPLTETRPAEAVRSTIAPRATIRRCHPPAAARGSRRTIQPDG
jgi:hypothetical protein